MIVFLSLVGKQIPRGIYQVVAEVHALEEQRSVEASQDGEAASRSGWRVGSR